MQDVKNPDPNVQPDVLEDIGTILAASNSQRDFSYTQPEQKSHKKSPYLDLIADEITLLEGLYDPRQILEHIRKIKDNIGNCEIKDKTNDYSIVKIKGKFYFVNLAKPLGEGNFGTVYPTYPLDEKSPINVFIKTGPFFVLKKFTQKQAEIGRDPTADTGQEYLGNITEIDNTQPEKIYLTERIPGYGLFSILDYNIKLTENSASKPTPKNYIQEELFKKTFTLQEKTDILCQLMVELLSLQLNFRLIHRDLKFDNILIDLYYYKGKRFFVVKIIDFDFSFRLLEDQFSKKAGRAGALQYIPPELLRGDTNYSFANDIFSIGIIVARMWDALKIRPEDEKITAETPFSFKGFLNSHKTEIQQWSNGLQQQRSSTSKIIILILQASVMRFLDPKKSRIEITAALKLFTILQNWQNNAITDVSIIEFFLIIFNIWPNPILINPKVIDPKNIPKGINYKLIDPENIPKSFSSKLMDPELDASIKEAYFKIISFLYLNKNKKNEDYSSNFKSTIECLAENNEQSKIVAHYINNCFQDNVFQLDSQDEKKDSLDNYKKSSQIAKLQNLINQNACNKELCDILMTRDINENVFSVEIFGKLPAAAKPIKEDNQKPTDSFENNLQEILWRYFYRIINDDKKFSLDMLHNNNMPIDETALFFYLAKIKKEKSDNPFIEIFTPLFKLLEKKILSDANKYAQDKIALSLTNIMYSGWWGWFGEKTIDKKNAMAAFIRAMKTGNMDQLFSPENTNGNRNYQCLTEFWSRSREITKPILDAYENYKIQMELK